MSASYDAVVIGAGIIGASVALELARKGWNTLGIDRLPAAGYGSTASSCAIIRTYYSTLDGSALAYEGYHYWDRWATHIGVEDERGLALFNKTGTMLMRTAANEHLARILPLMDELGIPYEPWSSDQIRARFPFYDLRSFGPPRQSEDPRFGQASAEDPLAAVFFPYGGYVSDPQLASHNVMRAAEAHGATFRFNASVNAIRRAGGRVAGVTLEGGETIDARVVVNVAGPHSFKVNEMAGVLDGMKISTRALRQEVAHVPAPPGFDFEHAGLVTSDSDIGCYCRPEIGNHVLIGSEDPECEARVFVDPDDFDRNFSAQWTEMVHRVGQRIPSLGIPGQASGVVDLYDVTEDWIPIYDRSDLDGFYMAVGSSGNQFKNGPVAGLLMATLIEACENGHDHDGEPLGFHLEHIGRKIDLGTFSRRREVNPASTFSVLG